MAKSPTTVAKPKRTVKKDTSRPATRARKTIREAAEKHKPVHIKAPTVETDQQIEDRIRDRFAIMGEITNGVLAGEHRGMIISGPAGVGKSYETLTKLTAFDPTQKLWSIDHGYVRATGLYKKFFEFRNPGNICVFDDADSIFNDESGLNLMKAATDTTQRRHMSWGSEYDFGTINGVQVPRHFDFEGGVIIITNLNLDEKIAAGHRMSPHYEALISRAHFIDLGMHSRHEAMIWVRHVARVGGLLTAEEHGLTEDQQEEVLQYMYEKSEDLRAVSLREAVKIARLMRSMPNKWRLMADTTCCVRR